MHVNFHRDFVNDPKILYAFGPSPSSTQPLRSIEEEQILGSRSKRQRQVSIERFQDPQEQKVSCLSN